MTIKKLLAETDVVIHAGDPDREGQLLIDEILQYLKFNGQVNRILINAKDDASLKRAFDQIIDNKKFRNLYEAGLGREQADWLVGMNLSRAYTVNARRYGYEETFRIGRVKVPTLALVVKREKEIQGFKPQKYYELQGKFQKDGVFFSANLQPGDKLPLDAEGRIVATNAAHDRLTGFAPGSRLGGSLQLDSALGVGTRIRLAIPLKLGSEGDIDARQPDEETLPTPFGGGRRLWVVEDAAETRGQLVDILENAGFVVACAEDGQAFIERIGAADAAAAQAAFDVFKQDGTQVMTYTATRLLAGRG